MNQILKGIVVVSLMMSGLTLNADSELHTSELATHAGFYVEPKLTYTMGEKVSHNGATLEGEAGYGIGLDIGYAFNEYFGVEIDGTYSDADVKETDEHGHSETAKGSFYTYGVNTVYTYPLHNHFIILGKLGYGYEHEDLGDLGIKGSSHGATWAAGIEYSFNPHVEVSLEYEDSDVRSARGDSIQLGLIYMF